METTEVAVVCVLVGLMLATTLLPFLLGTHSQETKKTKEEEKGRKRKAPRGVRRTQVCLRPGCLRCAYSSDGATRATFKQHLWRTFHEELGDHATHGPAGPQRHATLMARVGPAISRLVAETDGPDQRRCRPLLAIPGLPCVPSSSSSSLVYSSLTRLRLGMETKDIPFRWLDRLLASVPQMATEARRTWDEGQRERSQGEWRTEGVGVDGGGAARAWKWDLWNQGSLVESHARHVPVTVRLLHQHVGDELMVL